MAYYNSSEYCPGADHRPRRREQTPMFSINPSAGSHERTSLSPPPPGSVGSRQSRPPRDLAAQQYAPYAGSPHVPTSRYTPPIFEAASMPEVRYANNQLPDYSLPLDSKHATTMHQVALTQAESNSSERGGYTYRQVGVTGRWHPEESRLAFRTRYRGLFRIIQWLAVFSLVGALLSIPMLVTLDSRDPDDGAAGTRQTRNLIFYVFAFVLSLWCIAAFFHLLASALPYIFRFVAHYVNPAHKRYWRVLTMLKGSIIFVGTMAGAWIAYDFWITTNSHLVLNIAGIAAIANSNATDSDDGSVSLDDASSTKEGANFIAVQTASYIIEDILFTFILWAGIYAIEKAMITYLAVHYHFRSNFEKIKRSKRMLEALTNLYKVSYSLYPKGNPAFAAEDIVIHEAFDSTSGRRGFGSAVSGTSDKITGRFVSAFGIVFGSSAESHWFAPTSTYAIVNRALSHKASSAALAKRIWVSLVAEGSDVLTIDDLKDALGPSRQDEAEEFFAALDENENGDVRLNELVPTVVEAGKNRRDIYDTLGQLDHVINTFDWLLVGFLALVIIAMVLIMYVDKLKTIKDTISFAALGASFVIGRTLNEFIQGAIFCILQHPFDIGDTVELINAGESLRTVAVVKRISLLYTIFEEVNTGKQIQFNTSRLMLKRIQNLSRSGLNREDIILCVDAATSFKDLELLRAKLVTFISAPENSRDYCPDLSVRITNLHDLGKIELRLSVTHKSNWSDEMLRAARSSRIHCAIVAVCRRIPIYKPGGGLATLGDEGKPYYMVHISDEEASVKRATEKENQLKKRHDYVKPAPTAAPAPDTLDPAQEPLTPEQIIEKQDEELKVEKDKAEKEAKEAKEKAEEADAQAEITSIPRTNTGSLSLTGDRAAAATGRDDPNSPFMFISGRERGLRRTFGSR